VAHISFEGGALRGVAGGERYALGGEGAGEDKRRGEQWGLPSLKMGKRIGATQLLAI